jgi:hypothetical protein
LHRYNRTRLCFPRSTFLTIRCICSNQCAGCVPLTCSVIGSRGQFEIIVEPISCQLCQLHKHRDRTEHNHSKISSYEHELRNTVYSFGRSVESDTISRSLCNIDIRDSRLGGLNLQEFKESTMRGYSANQVYAGTLGKREVHAYTMENPSQSGIC